MRKFAGFMLAALLTVAPALANAYMLTVKAAVGGTTTVQVGGTTKSMTGGTAYFYPTNSQSVTVTATGGTVTKVGTTGSGSNTNAYTYSIPAPAPGTPANTNTVVASAFAATQTYTVTMTQANGGTVSMKLPNGTYSTTGATKVANGTSLPLTIAASTSYKITSYTIHGSTYNNSGAGWPAGTVLPVDYAVSGDDATITASFSLAPTISATLSAPSNGVTGTAVTCTASASAQGVAPSYFWSLDGVTYTPGTSTYSFSPATAGAKTVYLKVTASGASDFSTSATINVISAADYASAQCTSCHSGSTPAVVSAYNASSHQTGCQDCHTGLPHSSTVTGRAICGTCHTDEAGASKHTQAVTGYDCGTCHSGNVGYGYNATPTISGSSMAFARTSSASTNHRPELYKYATSDVCATCHSDLRTEFRATRHWDNHLEYGPEFAGGAVAEQMNANEAWTTTENNKLATCSLNCHFKPNLGPDPKAKNARATLSPGKDECLACHDPHKLTATYLTCHDCHRQTSTTKAYNTGHGLIPAEFYESKHWKNTFEYGPEFADQLNATYSAQLQVPNAKVTTDGTTTPGILDANDSYQTKEDGSVVTCAYRCHFRPGMFPAGVTPPANYFADGKATTYVTYTDTTGKYGTAGKVYSRPGGNSCMACHDPHGLEASAQSTCYTCHTGGNHGWSVAAFEKSTHFTGAAAKADGMDKEACLACHNAHSTEAQFANMSTASALHTAGLATGCQKCHTAGATVTVPGVGTFDISIFNADGTGKAPHFQTGTAGADGYYEKGSYDGGGATCVDCHYHNNSINAGWAKGSHASTTSVPLVTSAADNWNRGTKRGAVSNGRTYTGDYTVNAQVSDCQRCHTAAGFKLFYDSGFKNVSTVREGIKTSGPITCDACHVPKTAGTKIYAGAVRPLATGLTNIKTYVGNAKYLTNAADAVTTSMDFPANYKNSNVCIPCHAGRGTGALIKASFAAGTVLGNEYSADNARDILRIGTAIDPHFASAAGVVNGTSAYEYNPPAVASTHNRIGTGTGLGTTSTTMGPCVGCHMSATTEAHSLESVTYDADGKINGFATTACVNCHGVTTTAITPAGVQATKENFEAALNVLRNLLLNRGFDGLQAEIDARPGERVKMNMALGYTAYAAAGGTLSIKDFAERNTGAAFNWWQFGKSFKDGKTIILGDPAAYVHNPTYTRQVIMESIDWLDDFQMNNSAAAAIDAQVGAPVKTYGGVADGVPVDAAAAVKAKAFLGL